MRALVVACALGGVVLTGCGSDDGAAPRDPEAPRTIDVSSPAFTEGGPIPEEYTCRGKGISPELSWSGVPAEGQIALVVDDPDAPHGDYVHWIVIVSSGATGRVTAGAPPPSAQEVAGSGGRGWTAPCPPSGTHHYRFTVYALPQNQTFAVEGGSPVDFASVLAKEAVAWGRLTGTVTASGGDSGGGY